MKLKSTTQSYNSYNRLCIEIYLNILSRSTYCIRYAQESLREPTIQKVISEVRVEQGSKFFI